MKTITICGGGLAGLSLGIALRKRGVPVILHEAGNYPRHRVCGEFISGVSGETLRRLGIDELLADSERLQSVRWFVRDRAMMDAELPEPAMGISRHRLDARLAGMFEDSGGELMTRSRRKRQAAEGLVWAAGRVAERESQWIGLKLHASGLKREADLEMHLGKDGYIGLASIEDGRINACGLFRRKKVTGKGKNLLFAYLDDNRLGHLSRDLSGASCVDSSFVGVSAFRLGRQERESGLCVLGDAESMIPPFTGNGMSMAFESADVAVDPLRRWSAGEEDWETVLAAIRDQLADRFRRRLLAARLLHPFLFSGLGRNVLSLAARSGTLPFRMLLRLVR